MKSTESVPSASARPSRARSSGRRSDHDQAGTPALAFDKRIGGERGGERHEADGRGRDLGAGQHRIHRTGNADGEIMRVVSALALAITPRVSLKSTASV